MLVDMFEACPASCRALAAQLSVHHMTIWRWRIRVLAAFRKGMTNVSLPQAEAAAICRESRKASREWVNHARWPAIFPPPPRARWYDLAPGDAPPGGWSAWQIPVLVATSPTGPRLCVLGRGAAAGSGLRAAGRPSRLGMRLLAFLSPFRGPSVRYLAGYVAWLAVREAEMDAIGDWRLAG